MNLSRWTLWRVFWRSLFIQAGFSAEGLQTLGLVSALTPALEELYPDPQARQHALERHLSTFNTHPYVSAAIVGGIIFHEQRIARGEEPIDAVARFKASFMGPLAALGDGFFWLSLRPACAAISVALVPLLSAWAALLFLVLYNTVHLTARLWLFSQGLRRGEGMMPGLRRLRVGEWAMRLRVLATAAAAYSAGWLAASFSQELHDGRGPALAMGCVGVGLCSAMLAQRGVNHYVLVYAAALGAIALSLAM